VGATTAIFEEGEAAVALARLVLADTGAASESIERSLHDIRIRLLLENVNSLRNRQVRSIMIPWTRVRRLTDATPLDEVRRQVGEQHYSRWPVVRAATGEPLGYLLAKDLIGLNGGRESWTRLVRPLGAVQAADDVATTLQQFQREATSVSLVQEEGSPVGIVTLEDILEQVVGRIEDEYPRQPRVSLPDVVWTHEDLLDLRATTAEQAIREMVDHIPPDRLPANQDVANLAIAREGELPTSIGRGVAIPHARCPGLDRPLVVFARSLEGVQFNPLDPNPVHLIFLLVTPGEQPDLQVVLLSQVAAAAGDEARCVALRQEGDARGIAALLGAPAGGQAG